MKKSLLLAPVLALALTGCAYQTDWIDPNLAKPVDPLNFKQKTDTDSVAVTIVRDKGFFGSGLTVTCLANSVPVAKLEREQKATFYLKPGQYSLTCQGYMWGGRNIPSMYNTINAEENETFVFRVGLSDQATVLYLQSKNGVNYITE